MRHTPSPRVELFCGLDRTRVSRRRQAAPPFSSHRPNGQAVPTTPLACMPVTSGTPCKSRSGAHARRHGAGGTEAQSRRLGPRGDATRTESADPSCDVPHPVPRSPARGAPESRAGGQDGPVPEPIPEAEAYIQYRLNELSSRNEHHRFEEIATRIARKRISANLMIATGPVSAGGDQGRDAETFTTRIPDELPYAAGFSASASTAPVVLACTVQSG